MLHISKTLGLGGAERQVVDNAKFAQEKYIPVKVAYIHGSDGLVDELESAQISSIRLGHVGWRGLLKAGRSLRQELRGGGNGMVTVVCHDLYTRIVLWISGVSTENIFVVAVLHGMHYDAYPAVTLRKRLLKKLHARLLKHADRLIAVSGAVREHYNQHLGLDCRLVIPNGITQDVMEFVDKRSRRRALSSCGKVYSLVSVGRLVHEKGFDVLLEILKLLKEQLSFHCTIIGDGPMRGQLEAQVSKLRLTDKVTLLGSISHVDVLETLDAADLCLVTSRQEGFPLVPVESMALGVPVISSLAGGIPELICDGVNGFLVDRFEPAEFSEKIIKVLEDPMLYMDSSLAAIESVQAYKPGVLQARWLDAYLPTNSRT